jgi:transposase
MEKVPKGVYTKEFKEEAVKLVTEAGLSIPEVGRRLSVGKSTIEYWVRQARKGGLSVNHGKKPVTAEEMEVARLRREVAELRMERDILKNAAAYFAKESLKGTRS